MTDDVIFVADRKDKWSLGTFSPTFHGIVDLSAWCFGNSFWKFFLNPNPSATTMRMFAIAQWTEKRFV